MYKKFRQIPKIDRPREKLKNRGASCLSDQELIAILIGNGTKRKDVLKVAKEIAVKIYNDISTVKKLNKLQVIKGIGPVKASQIIAAFELAERYLVKEKRTITSPKEILPLVAELRYKKQEYFLTITIDGGSRIIKKRIVFIGTLDQSIIHPREVFAAAITDRARGLFLIHNHPSGNSNPSREDISITERLVQAGNIIGIQVIDHIILGKNSYFSFKENEYL